MEKCNNRYNSICRVCLKQNKIESMVSLKEKPGRRSLITYGNVLVRFAKISIDYAYILPTKICQNCKHMIQKINSFKLMCKNNDWKLRKFVNLSQNDSEKCKKMIYEYTMFCQYFPSESFKNTHSSPPTASSQMKMRKMEAEKEKSSTIHSKTELYKLFINDSEIDTKNPLHDKNIDCYDDTNHIDLCLDSIERAVTTKRKHKISIQNTQIDAKVADIDSFLDSIEKFVEVREKHSGIKTKVKPLNKFHCDICNHTLRKQYTYNYHMQQHTKYRYMCDQCGRGFPGKEPLNHHLVKVHDKGPSLLCSHCPFKCSKRFDLVEHIRIHTGERPFTCDKCGLTFRRRAIWTHHLVQHKEKTVCCNFCKNKFHRQSELKFHINSVHNRSFVYICNICNATYAANKTVRKHMISIHGIPRDKQGKITRIANDDSTRF